MKKMFAAIVAGALALSVAPAAVAASPAPRALIGAKVTVVHAVPNFDADVWVNGSKFIADFKPKSVAGPVDLAAGTYDIEVKPAGSKKKTPAVLSASPTLNDGDDVTIVAGLNASGAPMLHVFANDVSDPGSGNLRLFAAHVAAFGPAQIWANGMSLADNVPNGTGANFTVPEGVYAAWVASAGAVDPAIDPIVADLPANNLVQVFAFGPTAKGKYKFIVNVRGL
jgi:hypothetical protein